MKYPSPEPKLIVRRITLAVTAFVFSGLVLITPTLEAIASPVISSLSKTVVPQSGRFLVTGSEFGSSRGSSNVLVNGIPTAVATWTDTEVHAYILGDAPLGAANVSVETDAGTSNLVAIEIEPIELGVPPVKWRFQADSAYFLHRAAVGADGIVYASDVAGFLYALDSEGGLLWIFGEGDGGGEGPVTLGLDGTIYYTANPLGEILNIHALNPDGTLKWTFNDVGQEMIAGPNVGPDGNLYTASDIPGLGVYSLTPTGDLRWNIANVSDFGETGSEIVFDANSLYLCPDGICQRISFDGQQQWELTIGGDTRQATMGPEGNWYVETSLFGNMRLGAFNENGNQLWSFFEPPTNTLTAPDAGPDGTIYMVRNLIELHAVNPDGTQRWLLTQSDILGEGNSAGPVASPDNRTIVLGARIDFGRPGLIKAYSTDGNLLWNVELPTEAGWNIIPFSRPIFSADSSAAYIGTAGPSGDDTYSYLYALDTTRLVDPQLSIAPLESLEVRRGTLLSGDLGALTDSDEVSVEIAALPNNLSTLYFSNTLVTALSPDTKATAVNLTIEIAGDQLGIMSRVSLMNYATGSWDIIDTFQLQTTDRVKEYLQIAVVGNNYIRGSNGEIRVRILSGSQSSATPNGHTVSIDQVKVEVHL